MLTNGLVRCPPYAVYFATNRAESIVKIGRTWVPEARIHGLRGETTLGEGPISRYIVVCREDGDLNEGNLLRRFKHLRFRPDWREWFRTEPEILDFAESLKPGINPKDFDTEAHREHINTWREQRDRRMETIVSEYRRGISRDQLADYFGLHPGSISAMACAAEAAAPGVPATTIREALAGAE